MSSNHLDPQMLRMQAEGPIPQPPPLIRDTGLARNLYQEGPPPLIPPVERPLTENVRMNRARDRALHFADLLQQDRGNEFDQPVIPRVAPVRPHNLHLPEAGAIDEDPIPIPPPLIRRNRQELREFEGPYIPPPPPLREIDPGPLIPPPAPLRAMNAEPVHDRLTDDQRNIIRGYIRDPLIEDNTDPDEEEPLPALYPGDMLTNKYLKYKNKYLKLKMKNK